MNDILSDAMKLKQQQVADSRRLWLALPQYLRESLFHDASVSPDVAQSIVDANDVDNTLFAETVKASQFLKAKGNDAVSKMDWPAAKASYEQALRLWRWVAPSAEAEGTWKDRGFSDGDLFIVDFTNATQTVRTLSDPPPTPSSGPSPAPTIASIARENIVPLLRNVALVYAKLGSLDSGAANDDRGQSNAQEFKALAATAAMDILEHYDAADLKAAFRYATAVSSGAQSTGQDTRKAMDVLERTVEATLHKDESTEMSEAQRDQCKNQMQDIAALLSKLRLEAAETDKRDKAMFSGMFSTSKTGDGPSDEPTSKWEAEKAKDESASAAAQSIDNAAQNVQPDDAESPKVNEEGGEDAAPAKRTMDMRDAWLTIKGLRGSARDIARTHDANTTDPVAFATFVLQAADALQRTATHAGSLLVKHVIGNCHCSHVLMLSDCSPNTGTRDEYFARQNSEAAPSDESQTSSGSSARKEILEPFAIRGKPVLSAIGLDLGEWHRQGTARLDRSTPEWVHDGKERQAQMIGGKEVASVFASDEAVIVAAVMTAAQRALDQKFVHEVLREEDALCELIIAGQPEPESGAVEALMQHRSDALKKRPVNESFADCEYILNS